MVLCAKVESELIGLDEGDALEMLQSYGQGESGLSQLSRVGFDTFKTAANQARLQPTAHA